MVGALLGLPAAPPESDHAADALAVAICHASQSPAVIRIRGSATARRAPRRSSRRR